MYVLNYMQAPFFAYTYILMNQPTPRDVNKCVCVF